MLKLCITGGTGRMGKALVAEAINNPHSFMLTSVLVREGSSHTGNDDVPVLSDIRQALLNADAVIDFSRPDYSLLVAEEAMRAGVPMVCGTTGFTEAQTKRLWGYAQHIPLLWSANMSVGVTVLQELVSRTSRALGESWDIEILEMHHRNKIDAPSGTALALGEAAAKGRGKPLADYTHPPHQQVPGPRQTGGIGFSVLRGGDVVGEHTVLFATHGERIELSHRATDRSIFARGALTAAAWLHTQPAGWYGMFDVIRNGGARDA
jgi:4-hydroxy-tetrahydrodipicolinate reductase